MEYMKDARTGKFRLIEVNPRSWSWIGITPACGVSLPNLAYEDLTGSVVQPVRSQLKSGTVAYVKLLQDFMNSLFLYKKDYPLWNKSFTEWRKELKSYNKCIYAEFNAKDYPVYCYSLMNAAIMYSKSMMRKIIRR